MPTGCTATGRLPRSPRILDCGVAAPGGKTDICSNSFLPNCALTMIPKTIESPKLPVSTQAQLIHAGREADTVGRNPLTAFFWTHR